MRPIGRRGFQRDRERRPGAHDALRRECTAVGLDDRSGNRQPQPRFTRLLVTGLIGAIEAFEDVRQRLGRNPRAIIPHDQNHRPRSIDRAQRDVPAFRCVAQRIGDEVAKHLKEAAFIDVEIGQGA